MKQGIYEVKENKRIAENIYRMELAGDGSALTAPGQFVNIRLDGRFLRRPISVCDWDASSVTVIYKVLGAGTAQMSAMDPGTKLDILAGLGNGFDMEAAGEKPLIIGGGVGIPPLYGLAKRLAAKGLRPSAALGFGGRADAFYAAEFEAAGCDVKVASLDGSVGIKGFATDALPQSYTHFYACGPSAMLRAVYEKTSTDGQLSFEERMGCGFGACMGCSIMLKGGSRRVCKDGPVFFKSELLSEDMRGERI